MSAHLPPALPPHLRSALESEIDPGERLLWSAQPAPSRAFRAALPSALFMFAGFVAFATLCFVASRSIWQELHGLDPAIAWSQPGQRPSYAMIYVMAAFGALFILAALAGAASPWFAARLARRTIYAITPTRLLDLRVRRHNAARLEAIEPGHPLHVLRTDSPSGHSNIILYPGRGRQGRPMFQFLGIENGRAVERLIRATFDPPAPA